MDEIRGYIDNILEARVEARTESTPLSTVPEKADSQLERADIQAQGGFATLVNLGLVSSLLIAQQTKAFISSRSRKE